LLVLIPPRSLIDTANNLKLTQFVDVFTKANLLSEINKTRGITIFVPTNEAFNRPEVLAMDASKKDSLLPLHVINGTVMYEIKDGMSNQTINGDTLNFIVKNEGGSRTTLYVNNAKVEKSNVLLGNGIMYTIDNVLLPGEGEQNENNGSKDDKSNKETKNDPDSKVDGGGGKPMDKKLVIGAVLGGICGGIVISLTSCLMYKWYKAQRNARRASTSNVIKSNTIA